jgi:hypothetical protein
MLTLSVLAVCSVGAMDKGPFGKVLEDFKSGSYENAVSTAINQREEPASRFFLHEFFDFMLLEDPKLEQFREKVSEICSSANEEAFEFYSNRASMWVAFMDLAKEKYKETGNDCWKGYYLSGEEPSDEIEELPSPYVPDLNDDDDDGLDDIDLRVLLENARKVVYGLDRVVNFD